MRVATLHRAIVAVVALSVAWSLAACGERQGGSALTAPSEPARVVVYGVYNCAGPDWGNAASFGCRDSQGSDMGGLIQKPMSTYCDRNSETCFFQVQYGTGENSPATFANPIYSPPPPSDSDAVPLEATKPDCAHFSSLPVNSD